MQFTPKLYDKITSGDALSDTELQTACDHFEALEALLARTGPRWHLARSAAISVADTMRTFRDARRSKGQFSPKEAGVFDIQYRNGAYFVSIPNYDGGKVVTLERHEAAVAQANLDGRLSRASEGASALTREVLENIKTQIQARWKGGYPQEVVDDIVAQVIDPVLQRAAPGKASS